MKRYSSLVLLILTCLTLVSACGKESTKSEYASYDECLRGEIKKNNMKHTYFINSTCREAFPLVSSVSVDTNKEATKVDTNKTGYNTYAECMKDEIRKNSGKENRFINQYCREAFPQKTSEVEYTFQTNGSELVVQNEYRRRGNSISIAGNRDTTGNGQEGWWLRLYNQSNRNVTFLKAYSWYTKGSSCVGRNFNWDNAPNLLPGNQVIKPGQSMWIIKDNSFFDGLCYTYLAKEISYVKE